MKALFVGGTGTISTAVSERWLETGNELWLINRGSRNTVLPSGVHVIQADISNENEIAGCLGQQMFDVVADFIAYEPPDIERDFRLFYGRTSQYMFVSSASAYQKPLSDYRITEGTSLANPYWQYSRNKIACEELLMHLYREEGFPVTIIRPSHTYSERSVPVGIHGSEGSYQVLRRMLDGKKVLIHGDGTSLWTMTFSTDFARGFVGLMGNVRALGEAVQITSDESLTWNQIYMAIADALHVQLEPCYVASEFLAECSRPEWNFRGTLWGDKSHSVVFDTGKLKRLVPDYTATVRFDQGVRRSVEYVLSHPECQSEDPVFDRWCDSIVAAQDQALAQVLQATEQTICG